MSTSIKISELFSLFTLIFNKKNFHPGKNLPIFRIYSKNFHNKYIIIRNYSFHYTFEWSLHTTHWHRRKYIIKKKIRKQVPQRAHANSRFDWKMKRWIISVRLRKKKLLFTTCWDLRILLTIDPGKEILKEWAFDITALISLHVCPGLGQHVSMTPPVLSPHF